VVHEHGCRPERGDADPGDRHAAGALDRLAARALDALEPVRGIVLGDAVAEPSALVCAPGARHEQTVVAHDRRAYSG
jgi:hypothetical protein